jgi:hypothetical protein
VGDARSSHRLQRPELQESRRAPFGRASLVLLARFATTFAALAPGLAAALRGGLELERQIAPGVPAAPAKAATPTGDEVPSFGSAVRCKKNCHSSPNGDSDRQPSSKNCCRFRRRHGARSKVGATSNSAPGTTFRSDRFTRRCALAARYRPSVGHRCWLLLIRGKEFAAWGRYEGARPEQYRTTVGHVDG